MTGWKTWVATIVTACTGLAMVGKAVLTDPFDPNALYQGLLVIAGAFGIVGLGHKIEKSVK